MATWADPTTSTTYTNWPTRLTEHFDSQAKMFDDGVSWTGLPTGTVRWSNSNDRFEKWNGSAWNNLSTSLTGTLKAANNLSDVASVSSARGNLGLGAIALEASPLVISKGGTGATDQSGARTNLGLGSIATQNSNAVSISGGTLTGLTVLSMAASSVFQMTSGGGIAGVAQITNANTIEYITTGSDHGHYFKTNNIYRVIISLAAGMSPITDLQMDLGKSSTRWSTAYAQTVQCSFLNNTTDLAARISGTTYWVFDAGSDKNFRPNGNDTQHLGHASYKWKYGYINNILGTTGFITLNNGAGIFYNAVGSGGYHAFFTDSGVTALWSIQSDGRLNPNLLGRPNFTLIGLSPNTSLTISSTLTDVRNCLGSVIEKLTDLGLFQ